MMLFIRFFSACILSVIFFFLVLSPSRRGRPLLKGYLFAHRGLHDGPDFSYPENSLPAFREAVTRQYGVELDVQLTKDDIPVVFHDATLQRMCGSPLHIYELTLQQLREMYLDNSTETIPTLAEVLSVLGKAPLLCEIKTYRSVFDCSVCEIVLPMLKAYPGPLFIESFNPFVLRWLKRHARHLIRGQLSMDFTKEQEVPRIAAFMLTNMLLNFLARPDFLAYHFTDTDTFGWKLNRKFFGCATAAWTVRSPDDMKEAEKTSDAVIFENFLPQQKKNG